MSPRPGTPTRGAFAPRWAGASTLPPFVAEVRRREPHIGPTLTPATRNIRALERIDPATAEAPEPPRQGDTPARPARQQIYQALSIAAIRAVQADEFVVVNIAPDHHAAYPRGAGMLAWNERGNIISEQPEAYGSSFGLVPTGDPGEHRLRTLMAVPS